MTVYDKQVVAAAEAVVEAAIAEVLRAKPHQAVVGVAPAGAGKSYAVGTAVMRARAKKLRVAVATPTNEQAFALISDLADRLPGETITFVPAGPVNLPENPIDTRLVPGVLTDEQGDEVLLGKENSRSRLFHLRLV